MIPAAPSHQERLTRRLRPRRNNLVAMLRLLGAGVLPSTVCFFLPLFLFSLEFLYISVGSTHVYLMDNENIVIFNGSIVVTTWAVQVLRTSENEIMYRKFTRLGTASTQIHLGRRQL